MSEHQHSKTVLVGLSGPSCSGKTTLARLLRDALSPQAFILHEDDFYKTDAEVPIVKTPDGRELQDWDCLESLNLPLLKENLAYIKAHGRLNPDFKSQEDENEVGEVTIDAGVLDSWRARFHRILNDNPARQQKIAIVDGFLLFSEEMREIRDLFDMRLLLTIDYDTLKRRREARKGYVTLEGFWEDPPGYVDDVVWPNFVKDHSFLFRSGDVGGQLNTEVCSRLAIENMPQEAAHDMTLCLNWAAEILSKVLLKH